MSEGAGERGGETGLTGIGTFVAGLGATGAALGAGQAWDSFAIRLSLI